MAIVDTQLKVSFIRCTGAQFDTLDPKDSNAIYFLTDRKEIYQGTEKYTSASIEFRDTVPEFEEASDNVLYIVKNPDTGEVTIYVKGTTDMETPAGTGNVDISDLNDILDTDGSALADDDTKIPTSGAVQEAITSALSEYNGAIVDVQASRSESNDGTVLTFTPKEGEPKTVTISDLFLSAASYDAESHKLSLTVTGSDSPVEVDMSDLIPEAVSTTDVAMASNITCTVDVGNYKAGDMIDISTTENLQQFLVNMLSQDINPTTTQPSASITLSNAGAKEVGTVFEPNYSASLNPGSYSATAEGAQPTQVTATSWAVIDTNDGSKDTQTGTFNSFTVEDSTNYRCSVTVQHSAGIVPKTFLGVDYPSGQIQAGSKTANSAYVTGYRMGFYGALVDKTGTVDSALVRGLTGKSNKKVAKGQTYTISVPSGVSRIVLAYDATIGDVASITSAEELGSEIKDSFVKQNVDVEGANSYSAISYNVYVKDLANPQENATTYTVTI